MTWHGLVHRRLVLRVTVPVIVGVVMLGFVLIDLIEGRLPPLALRWALAGLALGYPFGRLTKVSWDSESSQVVRDGGQVAILLAYLVFRRGSRA